MVGWTRVNSLKNLLFDEIARYLSKRFNAESLDWSMQRLKGNLWNSQMSNDRWTRANVA